MQNFRFHFNGLSGNQDLLHTYHPFYSVSHHRNRRLCLELCGQPPLTKIWAPNLDSVS